MIGESLAGDDNLAAPASPSCPACSPTQWYRTRKAIGHKDATQPVRLGRHCASSLALKAQTPS